MSIEYVCIVGAIGMTEEERERGCVDGCATCGAIGEEYLRVNGRLLCPRCAAWRWTVERDTHADLAAERMADMRRIVEHEDCCCKDFVQRGTPGSDGVDGACVGINWWQCNSCARLLNSGDRASLIVRARDRERCSACGLEPLAFEWRPIRTPDEGPIEALRCSCANGHRWTAQERFVPTREDV